MALKEHIRRLQEQHPGESVEMIRLACFLNDDMDMAKEYARTLLCCNDYRDIAWRVVRKMYVTCQIDRETALREKTYIRILLDLSNYGKRGNPHSASHHIAVMLTDPSVRKERKECERTNFIRNVDGQRDSSPNSDISGQEEVTIVFSPQHRRFAVPVIQAMVDSGAVRVVRPVSHVKKIMWMRKTMEYVVMGSLRARIVPLFAEKQMIWMSHKPLGLKRQGMGC